MEAFYTGNETNIESTEEQIPQSTGTARLALLAAVGIGSAASLSQMVVIWMAAGLEGNFSAKTFMVVQAVVEIAKRGMTTYFALCSALAPRMCVMQISNISCKLSLFVVYLLMLVPDWLTMLIAADRLVAVFKGNWYRVNCTTRAAWLPIWAMIAVLAAIGAPRFVYGQHFPGLALCTVTNVLFRGHVSILGFLALVLILAMTVVLIWARKRVRSAQSSNRVNTVLLINCVVFCIFSTMQFSIMLFIEVVHKHLGDSDLGDSADNLLRWRQTMLGLTHILGAIGVTVKAPLYLLMAPMRAALMRTVRKVCHLNRAEQ